MNLPARAQVAVEAVVGNSGREAPCECDDGWEACGAACEFDACDCSCAGHAVNCDAAARACHSKLLRRLGARTARPILLLPRATWIGAPATAVMPTQGRPLSTNGADGVGCVISTATAWNKLRLVGVRVGG